MSPPPLRVGIVGLGFGQGVLLPAFRMDPRCEVVALAATSQAAAEAAALTHDVAHAFGDWRELVTSPHVDLVAMAVPPVVQTQIVEAAAAHGKHVFCEKPLGADLASCNRAVDVVVAARVQHAVDFEFCELPAFQATRDLLRRGTLGPLRFAALTWRVETVSYKKKLETWKVKSELGGGALNNFGSHSFHYLEWLFGKIERLNARLGHDAARGGDSRFSAWMEMSSGLPVEVTVAADAHAGPGHRLEVYGEKGSLVLENRGNDYMRGFTVTVALRESGRAEQLELPEEPISSDGRVPTVGLLVRRFVDAILERRAFSPSLFDGLRVQQLIEAARSASASGTWVSV